MYQKSISESSEDAATFGVYRNMLQSLMNKRKESLWSSEDDLKKYDQAKLIHDNLCLPQKNSHIINENQAAKKIVSKKCMEGPEDLKKKFQIKSLEDSNDSSFKESDEIYEKDSIYNYKRPKPKEPEFSEHLRLEAIVKKPSDSENENNFAQKQSNLKNKCKNGNKSLKKMQKQSVVSQVRKSDVDNFKLNIKIYSSQENLFKEFLVDPPVYKGIFKQFPKFEEFLKIKLLEKKLNYSAEAVFVLFGFLFELSFDFKKYTEKWRLILEACSLANTLEIASFSCILNEFLSLNPINIENAKVINSYAKYFGIKDISSLCSKVLKDTNQNMIETEFNYCPKPCMFSAFFYKEPKEFLIPVFNHETGTLKDRVSEKSIKNEIHFKSLTGSYNILGIEIELKRDDDELKGDKVNIKVHYKSARSIEIPECREKYFGPKMRLQFRQNLFVECKENALISVELDIKPDFCPCYKLEELSSKTPDEEFTVTLTSNYRVQNTPLKRVYISKILYSSNPIPFL